VIPLLVFLSVSCHNIFFTLNLYFFSLFKPLHKKVKQKLNFVLTPEN